MDPHGLGLCRRESSPLASLLLAAVLATASAGADATRLNDEIASADTRAGGPVVYDGGGPGRVTHRIMSIVAQADSFVLASPTTIDAVRFWTGEPNLPWSGSGTYRIFANGAGGVPGALLLSGTLTAVSRTATGFVVTGFPEFEHVSDLNPKPSLSAGTYWLNMTTDGGCTVGADVYWSLSAAGSGPPAAEGIVFDCSMVPFIASGPQFAYQLLGPTVSCVDCTGATVVEVEPDCGEPLDTINGGCNASPQRYTPIVPGDTICGSGYQIPGHRDTDWYSFSLSERSQVTLSAQGERKLQLAIFDFNCPPTPLHQSSPPEADCVERSVTALLDPGDYVAFVALSFPPAEPVAVCPSPYRATLTAVPDGDPCEDDTTPPTAVCNGFFVNCLDSNGEAYFPAEWIDGGSFDDCGSVTVTSEPSVLDCSNMWAPVVVTLTATDESGNTATCQTTVGVSDCEPPAIVDCPDSFTTTCNTEGGYNLDYVPTLDDNCGAWYSISPANPLPYGTTTVTVTATDYGGNSVECTFDVTVVPEPKDPYRVFSTPSLDGWVRESSIEVRAPGPISSASTIDVGDDGGNWGRRGLLSFDTSGIPEDATITGARIRLSRSGLTGNVSALGSLVLDMGGASSSSRGCRGCCSGLIGLAALESADYHTTVGVALDVASSFPAPGGNGFTTFAELGDAYLGLIDRGCTTQFRVRFENESDDDFGLDCILFHGGEAGATLRPELIVDYHTESCLPCPATSGCDVVTVTLWSTPNEDGGMVESHWTSEVGGSAPPTASFAPVGDTAQRQQQQILVNFDTSGIPAGAEITSAELRVYRASATGGWAAFGPLLVGMRPPCAMPWWFGGSGALETVDFQAVAPLLPVGSLTIPPTNTYTATLLNPAGIAAINKGGMTQMKLFYALADDGDALADQVQIGMGNYGATSPGRPRLVVTYNDECGAGHR